MAATRIRQTLIPSSENENVVPAGKQLAGKTNLARPHGNRLALGDIGNRKTISSLEPTKPLNHIDKFVVPDKIVPLVKRNVPKVAPIGKTVSVAGKVLQKKCEKTVNTSRTSVTEKSVTLRVTTKSTLSSVTNVGKPIAVIGKENVGIGKGNVPALKSNVPALKPNVPSLKPNAILSKENIRDKVLVKKPKDISVTDKALPAAKENAEAKDKTNSAKDEATDNDGTMKTRASALSEHKFQKSYSTAALDVALANNEVSETVINVFKNDECNPLIVTTYIMDIYSYLYELEDRFSVKQGFLATRSVNSRMRAVLVDWLIDVHRQFNLLQETLYLTTSIIDRYLQASNSIDRSNLQLLGMAAMLVASKYEEMYAPEVSDFEFMADNAYSKKEILAMERSILKTLNFNLGQPLPLHFLRMYSKAANASSLHHTLSKYLMELCVVDYELCYNKSSAIAAAALYVSLNLLNTTPNKKIWTSTLQFYSHYSEKSICPLANKIAMAAKNAETSKFKAVREKYAQAKFSKVSTLPQLKNVSTLIKTNKSS